MIRGEESMNKTLKVAVIGLGFGAEFVPIYQDYSLTQCYAVCRRAYGIYDQR